MFTLRKLEAVAPQLHLRLANVPDGPFLTMEALPFQEIKAEMDNSPIQHYVSCLHGSVNAGKAVLCEEEFLPPPIFDPKMQGSSQKQESSSRFIFNFHGFPRPNGIGVPRLPTERKFTYFKIQNTIDLLPTQLTTNQHPI
jgi:hypothetical protein